MHFQFCFDHVLIAEGGFVDNPLDRGGPTNLGITQATLSIFLKRRATVQDVRDLSRSTAVQVYKTLFWDKMNLDELSSWRLCLILFDQGVNSGPTTAVTTLQRVLNERFLKFQTLPQLKVDGILGNKTIEAIESVNESRLCRKLLQEFQRRYISICLTNQSQMGFLMGWLNRTYSLWDATI